MARRTGSADAMERQAITAGRPQYQIGADRTVPNRPSLTAEERQNQLDLSRVTPEQWIALGRMAGKSTGGRGGGGGTPSDSPASAIPAPPSPGGSPAQTANNVDTLSKMYADALAELQRQYGVSQKNIMDSIGRMRSDPYNTANAYAAMQILNPQVAANPVAEYMAAAGMSPGQAQAAQAMAQAEADAYRRAMQNVQNIMSTSQQQANASRMADIGLIETGATQDLESNLNMLRLGLEKERIGAVTGQQQTNLTNQMNMRNNIVKQITDIFSGQNVAPESILKLIEAALAKMNTNRWTTMPTMGG